MNKTTFNGKHIIEMSTKDGRSSAILKILSVCYFILSIIYLVIPYDCDTSTLGRVDDFMLFMSAFCFIYAQFMSKYKIKAALILKMFTLVFLFIGVLSFLLLIFIN